MSSAVMGYPAPRAGGTDISHMAKISQTNRPGRSPDDLYPDILEMGFDSYLETIRRFTDEELILGGGQVPRSAST
jgi:hypothetical protein